MSDTRHERSRALCRLLVKRIGEIASPGLGDWGPAWGIVADASDELLDALADYELTGHEGFMEAAKRAAVKVLDAWREAEAAYQRERRNHIAGRHLVGR